MPNNKTNTTLMTEDIVRLPLVSPNNIRNLDSSQANKDKRFINCFAEKIRNPLSSSANVQYYVTKRPGFATHTTPEATSVASAICVWSVNDTDAVITAFGATNSTLYTGTTELGTVTGVSTFINQTLVAGTANIVTTTTSNKAYYSTGGTFTEITDGDFPSNAGRTITGPFVFVDGYAFIMDTSGRIYNSDLNSIANWTADSYIAANIYPDTGVGLARYKNMIVAFGKETVEFFYNAGNTPGSPLSRYESGFVHFGCVSQYGFAQIEDTIGWVSASDKSGLGVFLLDGVQPKKVSNPYIESQLATSTTAGIFVTAGKIVGKTFLIVTSSVGTFVYVVEDDMWHEWSSTTVLWHHMSGTTAGARKLYSVSRTSTSGKVFVINPASLTYQDNAAAYTMTLQTAKFDGDTVNYKFQNKLSVIGDKTASANAVSVSWSDDDYQTWSTARTIDLANNDPYLMNGGKFRRRAYKLTNAVNNPVRLEAIELQLKQGIH